MEKTSRLEFNEKQQQFHLDNGTHEEYTHGWVTVFENCSDLEFHFFEAYLKTHFQKPYKKNHILKCAKEVCVLMNFLIEKEIEFNFKRK